jgi:predicted negative regulator of RcsB-dependent stress response
MTRFKRRILIGTALVVLVLLGVGVWFYFNFFASTSSALRRLVT